MSRIYYADQKAIDLDRCPVVYSRPFSEASLREDFEAASGSWSVTEDGWLTGSGSDGDRSWLELELEDERANPKYGIMAVRSYLEKAHFPADTTIELAGMESPIYG